jgi:hypothetical protein
MKGSGVVTFCSVDTSQLRQGLQGRWRGKTGLCRLFLVARPTQFAFPDKGSALLLDQTVTKIDNKGIP